MAVLIHNLSPSYSLSIPITPWYGINVEIKLNAQESVRISWPGNKTNKQQNKKHKQNHFSNQLGKYANLEMHNVFLPEWRYKHKAKMETHDAKSRAASLSLMEVFGNTVLLARSWWPSENIPLWRWCGGGIHSDVYCFFSPKPPQKMLLHWDG